MGQGEVVYDLTGVFFMGRGISFVFFILWPVLTFNVMTYEFYRQKKNRNNNAFKTLKY